MLTLAKKRLWWWYVFATKEGGIAAVQFHFVTVIIPRTALLILSLIVGPLARAADEPVIEATEVPYAWENVLAGLEKQLDQLLRTLENARGVLRVRAQAENPDFVARLYLERPRRAGYQVVPAIRHDKPLASVTPRQRTYSLEVLHERVAPILREAVDLNERAFAKPSPALEPLVTEFGRLRGQLHDLEERFAYHSQWQRAVVEQGAFFAERNRIAASIGEMQAVQASGGSADRVAALRQAVQERVTEFAPTTNLAIKINGDGIRILPVAVYTDIEDEEFLQAFREGVESAFKDSEAARSQRFAVRLEIRHLTATELYPQGAPARGTAISVKEHLARYPEGALILTTGGKSTHSWVGRNITLGPDPITPRTLAHEFGHLLGFSDAYLRSYQGDPRDPYGVVLLEWTGLIDNLMGSPAVGRVTEAMIETLIDTYGERQDQ
jgi:hypothetical protein